MAEETNNNANSKVEVSKNENSNTQNSGKSSQNKRKYYHRNKNRGRYYKPKSQDKLKAKVSFKKVSIVVPLFNEEESLRPLHTEIIRGFSTLPCSFEIIFVDDGSTDKSLEVIKELAVKNKKIRYISFRKNYGKSAALNAGFKLASGDAVITMDADLQDDPLEIPNLLAKLDEGYDLVSGWKKQRFDPFIKRHSSKFFNYMTGLMSGIKIHDFNCGLKAYRADVVKNVNVYGEMHRYIPVLANWQGYRVTEIVVKHHARRYGNTKFGISRFFKGFVDLITVTFTTRYIKRPMHLFGFLGALSIFLGFIVSAYLTFTKLFWGWPLSNRPLLFLGMLLIIVGVQFFSVGLLGEIMVHSSYEEKDYNIKESK